MNEGEFTRSCSYEQCKNRKLERIHGESLRKTAVIIRQTGVIRKAHYLAIPSALDTDKDATRINKLCFYVVGRGKSSRNPRYPYQVVWSLKMTSL